MIKNLAEKNETMKPEINEDMLQSACSQAFRLCLATIHTKGGETPDSCEDVSRAHLKNLNSMVLFFTDRVTHFTFFYVRTFKVVAVMDTSCHQY